MLALTPNRSFPPLPSQQSGAMLIVGLVLLLVLTVIGVSGMRTATMEITMASNTQFEEDAFQAAEDAIDLAIGTRDYTTDTVRTIAPLNNPDYDRWATTTYRCNTFAPGFTIGEYDAFHFDTNAVGRGPRGAPANHLQSFYVVASHIDVTSGGC